MLLAETSQFHMAVKSADWSDSKMYLLLKHISHPEICLFILSPYFT